MRLSADEARTRLGDQVHGVLCTLHPERGPDPQPVVYAVSADGHVGCPHRPGQAQDVLAAAARGQPGGRPRGSLLIEHWETEDWSRLWWVRARLDHVPHPPPELVDELADRLSRAVPQYADKPFHRVLVCRIVDVTGWAASEHA